MLFVVVQQEPSFMRASLFIQATVLAEACSPLRRTLAVTTASTAHHHRIIVLCFSVFCFGGTNTRTHAHALALLSECLDA